MVYRRQLSSTTSAPLSPGSLFVVTVSFPQGSCKNDCVHPVAMTIANSSGLLDPHLEVIVAAFESATSHAQTLLGAEGIDVLFVDAAGETIPEWGVGGYTYGPHVILIALDSAFALAQKTIETTLVHEYHHAMRWRGPGCGGDLAHMLVSEGLAQLFEEEALGEAPFFSRVAIKEDEVTRARASLYSQPFSQAKWFFGSDGITRHFGYTYGYQLCRAYATASGKRASELVDVPTREVVTYDSAG